MEPRVLERDSGLRGNPFRQLLGLDVEAPGGGIEQQLRVGVGVFARKVERQRAGPAARLAEPTYFDASVQHLRTARPSRFGDDLEDQRHERSRVVRGGQRVAHERDRLPRVSRGGMRLAALVTEAGHRSARLVRPHRAEKRKEQRERGERDECRERDQQHMRCGRERPAVMRS